MKETCIDLHSGSVSLSYRQLVYRLALPCSVLPFMCTRGRYTLGREWSVLLIPGKSLSPTGNHLASDLVLSTT